MTEACAEIPQVVHLGGATSKAVERFANFIADTHIKGAAPVPDSPFLGMVADLVCGKDRRDFTMAVVGKKGAGKSRTALYIGERLSIEISKRLGKDPVFYFDPRKNVVTLDDSQAVAQTLHDLPKHSILIVDDAGVTANNRAAMTIANRNLLAIATTIRTSRLVVIYTMVSADTIDIGLRNLLDAKIYIYKSCHSDGFNICKVMTDASTIFGKKYSSRITVGKKKIDFWAAFNPSPETVEGYEEEREASARRLVERTVKTGKYNDHTVHKTSMDKMASMRDSDAERLKVVGDKLRKQLATNPKTPMTDLEALCGCHRSVVKRLLIRLKEES